MAFIRTKKVKGKEYRYLVESYRDRHTGKIRQRTLKYLGADKSLTFAEYLKYDDGTNNRYELVNRKLVLMPPASFLHSDIVEFIADLIKAICRENELDIKVKTGDVGVRTGIDSSRIPDIAVIDGQIWQSYQRDKSAVIEAGLMLAVEVVSPGTEQIERDYVEKVAEYQNSGVVEYWIVDPIGKKITVLVLEKDGYHQTVFVGTDAILSATFSMMQITAAEIWQQKKRSRK
ncbi:MAG TPA: Uma2 family endonuclease [Xenococcaceae cyanobacterium]|jgi:Uma2 family endonuclease